MGKHQAVRVAPQTWRGVWNDDSEDGVLIFVSTRIADPGGDGETLEEFWPR